MGNRVARTMQASSKEYCLHGLISTRISGEEPQLISPKSLLLFSSGEWRMGRTIASLMPLLFLHGFILYDYILGNRHVAGGERGNGSFHGELARGKERVALDGFLRRRLGGGITDYQLEEDEVKEYDQMDPVVHILVDLTGMSGYDGYLPWKGEDLVDDLPVECRPICITSPRFSEDHKLGANYTLTCTSILHVGVLPSNAHLGKGTF